MRRCNLLVDGGGSGFRNAERESSLVLLGCDAEKGVLVTSWRRLPCRPVPFKAHARGPACRDWRQVGGCQVASGDYQSIVAATALYRWLVARVAAVLGRV